MRTLLICASDRSQVSALAEAAPLALAPLLGQSLLEYWLSHLACTGTKEVTVLAHDRPEQVRLVAGNGERWGLKVSVAEESRELSPAQALLKHAPELDAIRDRCQIVVLDQLPGRPENSLFMSYAGWFSELLNWMGKALTPDRIGMREVKPGIWKGVGSQVSAGATLYAPCWVGRHAFVGQGAVVGPNTVIEDGCFIEPAAEIANSCIGADTFVGRFARIDESVALGNTLVNWKSGCAATVTDAFLLSALRRPRQARGPSLLRRLANLRDRNKEEAAGLWKHLLLNKEG